MVNKEEFDKTFNEEFQKIIDKYNYINRFSEEQIEYLRNLFYNIAKERIMKRRDKL